MKGALFDLAVGRCAKQQGMDLAALHRADVLAIAKLFAIELGMLYGEVHMDMVMRRLVAKGIHPSELGNAAGSIFRGQHWEFTGKWYRSRRVTNHARCFRIWRFKG